ncbi:uncharacterized protein SCHCODRAFT_02587196 [Schizophyllum commune H4-8]|nr:uncharacterized protein SCHCODRAFT_02587196 [Schizophyllum commune H4-8]KAI5888279.1 hypothetical protein SCHCODRAFT_02587196 [Schizophyllum commune H4-8]
MSSRQRSPSIEIVSFGPPAQPRKPALVDSTRTRDNQSTSGAGASTKGASAHVVKRTVATASAEKPQPSTSAGSKRKSLDAPTSAAKRTKTSAAPKENKAKVEEKKDPTERWKWIDLARPELCVSMRTVSLSGSADDLLYANVVNLFHTHPDISPTRHDILSLSSFSEIKGTKIEAFNCGGTFFKSTAKTVADRLDKLESFLAECEGDETCHPTYGYPEAYKPKRVTKKKGEPEDTRWQWIDNRRPEMRFKGTKIEAYNCGGAYWKATGKTIADRLDKMERFLAECEGDETCHPRYTEQF